MRYYESAYPVFASSDGVGYEVFLSGCHGYCEGCHSPHTHDFNTGLDLNDSAVFEKLINDIKSRYDKGQLDNIIIMGGEPLDHDDAELIQLINAMRRACPNAKIWMYTHYDEHEVKDDFFDVWLKLDYVKCGMFDKSKLSKDGFKDPLTGVTLATSNQYFIEGGYQSCM